MTYQQSARTVARVQECRAADGKSIEIANNWSLLTESKREEMRLRRSLKNGIA
jgi:KaiC/GvpD/RAD55 family RecA-like ATPase